jgi:hypothetical protein
VPSLRQHHDDIDEPLALHGRDGDTGSEGPDADAEAEAEAAAATAAEAADYDCAEEWGGDAGGDSGSGGASADPYRAANDDGTAATPPWAAAQGVGADGEEAELPRPPRLRPRRRHRPRPRASHLALPRMRPCRHAVR